MTEPTDAEIIALADETRTGEPGRGGYILPISFDRAVLARWGQPAPRGVPVAWLSPWRADQVTTDHHMACVAENYAAAAFEQMRPSVLYRPALSIDGNQWCALYGEDLQAGVAGFGDTPALAMQDFDKQWNCCDARAAQEGKSHE